MVRICNIFTERRRPIIVIIADKQTKQDATGQLFGNLFSAYDDKAYVASMELFSRRFEENEFPPNWFNLLSAHLKHGFFRV